MDMQTVLRLQELQRNLDKEKVPSKQIVIIDELIDLFKQNKDSLGFMSAFGIDMKKVVRDLEAQKLKIKETIR